MLKNSCIEKLVSRTVNDETRLDVEFSSKRQKCIVILQRQRKYGQNSIYEESSVKIKEITLDNEES